MGGLPLGTPRHHRHGGPLPRRPANATRANPAPPKLWREGDAPLPLHGVLVSVSRGCPPVRGMSLTRYAPFRRSPAPVIADRPAAPRLACVRPAASVHPEPGSNSSLYNTTFVFFPCTGRSFPRPEGAGSAGPARASFFRFNELPPIRGGGTEAPFPNGTAKVALFAGFPNFSRTFFRLFSVFFRFSPACHALSDIFTRMPPLSSASPGRGTHPQGQTTGKHGIAPRHIPWARNGHTTGRQRFVHLYYI